MFLDNRWCRGFRVLQRFFEKGCERNDYERTGKSADMIAVWESRRWNVERESRMSTTYG